MLATGSPAPVIEAAWLAPGTYVATLGPKQRGRAEFGLDLPAAAAVIVTDSLAQIDAYHPTSLLVGTPHRARPDRPDRKLTLCGGQQPVTLLSATAEAMRDVPGLR